MVALNEYRDKVTKEFKYRRYMFDFDSSYRDQNLLFVFDTENDEYIGSDENYHFVANDRFLRYKKSVPNMNRFLHDFYMTWRSSNKTVIANQGTWDRLNPTERN